MHRQFTLAELAKLTDCTAVGDSAKTICGVNTLEKACTTDASFLANPRYLDAMKQSSAGVICVQAMENYPPEKNFLVSNDPSRAFQKIAELVLADRRKKTFFEGIHSSAVIHPSVQLGENVTIGPNVSIDAYVKIGKGTTILAGSHIGPYCEIGNDTLIYSHVSVREGCVIGNNVTLQPGVVIGSCGFGFTTDKEGKHHKLEQIGNVVIEDGVEIGANTTIDRARFQSTIIKEGTQIDNLVQIAHNVEIGEHCIIVSQTGIAGSTKIGRNVVLGGQSGIVGHIEICPGAMVASRGGVSKSITKPGMYRGEPVQPIEVFNREKIHVRRIEKYYTMIRDLSERLEALEKKSSK